MRYISVFIILIVLPLLATQCPIQPANLAAQSVEEAGQGEDRRHDGDAALEEPVALSPVDLGAGEKLRVIATTSIVGDLVRNVGGDLVDLTVMLPLGVDPHTFNPTPADAASVADAHIIFANGLNLEEFLESLIKNAGGKATIVAVSTGVEPRRFGEGHSQTQDLDETGNGDVRKPGRADPHIWLIPANAIVMIHNIEQALSQLDPAHADAYQANAGAYQLQLQELDDWVSAQIESIPPQNREMVTDHDAFGYYADHYGLQVVGAVIPAYSTNAEPSARELAELQKAIEEFDAKAVFVGTSINVVLAERIAQDMGIKLIPLYTGSLGEPGSGVETYLDYIRFNTTAIVDALS